MIGWWKKNGLRELGWCSKYLLDRRSVNYLKDQQEFKKTEIVEFYWFSSSPNWFNKKTSFTPFDYVIACVVTLTWIDFLEIKYE